MGRSTNTSEAAVTEAATREAATASRGGRLFERVPSSEATVDLLASKPNVAVVLNKDQGAAVDRVQAEVDLDPAAYLRKCREESGL